MEKKKNQKMIMFALLLAIVGVLLYLITGGLLKIVGLILITLAFLLYAVDSFSKFAVSKRIMDVIGCIFFIVCAGMSAYMAYKLYIG